MDVALQILKELRLESDSIKKGTIYLDKGLC
jgi:hypothetical protein